MLSHKVTVYDLKKNVGFVWKNLLKYWILLYSGVY